MIPKTLDKIEAADIQSLVTNGDEERRTMDFKRDLPGNTDKDKNELRADVTSFANAGGGDLIFGVDEAGGVATAVPGLPGVDADAEIRRIESVIQSSIDPRVPGFESRAISIPGKGPVIVVRVPKSWRGPHLVKINDTFRMFGRNSKGKYIFDGTEIRSAFAISAELPERIRKWRDGRIASIVGGDTPVQLLKGPTLVVHVVPISSFMAGMAEWSVPDLVKNFARFPPPDTKSWLDRPNLDGMVTYEGGQSGGHRAYCQVFRTGRVEAVAANLGRGAASDTYIPSRWFEKMILKSIESYVNAMREMRAELPILLMLTISGVKGVRYAVGESHDDRGDNKCDRDMILLPEVLVDSWQRVSDTAMKPVLDAVWNAAGLVECLHYDKAGNWNPQG